MSRDHRLTFQSYSSQRQCDFGFFTMWHSSRVEQSAALGKVARSSIDWQDAAYHLSLPSSGACAVVQLSPSKWQCERQASLKAALGDELGDLIVVQW